VVLILTAWAWGADEPPAEALPLEALLGLELASPALRTRSPVEAPGIVYVYTAEEIRLRGYRHLGELLQDVPELTHEQYASPDVDTLIGVRGLVGNQRLLVMVDGVRLNPMDGSPCPLGENLPLLGVRQVEVVVGPASAVYGADAFAGVVHIRTQGREGIHVEGKMGSFGGRAVSLVAGLDRGGVQLRATGHLYHSDGAYLPEFWPNAYAWYTDHYRTDGLMLVSPGSTEGVEVALRPWSNRRDARYLHLEASTAGFRLGYLTSAEAHPSATGTRPEYSLYAEEARLHTELHTLYAQHQARFAGDRVEWRTELQGAEYRLAPDSAFVNSYSGYERAYKYAQSVGVRLASRLSWRPRRWMEVTAGLDGVNRLSLATTADLATPFDPTLPAAAQGHIVPGSDVTASDGHDLSVPQAFYTVPERQVGAYAEVGLSPSRTVDLTGGLRVDTSGVWGWATHPRVVVGVRPLPAFTMKFLYGTGYLDPSWAAWREFGRFSPAVVDGEVVGLESDFFHLPNPALGSGRQVTWCIGVGVLARRGLRLGGDAWVSNVHDLVVFRASGEGEAYGWPVDVVETAVNEADGQTWGGTLRAEGVVELGPLSVRPELAWTYTDGRIDGDPLPYAPPHSVHATLAAEGGGASFSLDADHRSRRLHPDAARGVDADAVAPASTLWSAHARWAPGTPGGRVRGAVTFDVENLFDARAFEVGTTYTDAFRAVPGQPRTVMLGLELDL